MHELRGRISSQSQSSYQFSHFLQVIHNFVPEKTSLDLFSTHKIRPKKSAYSGSASYLPSQHETTARISHTIPAKSSGQSNNYNNTGHRERMEGVTCSRPGRAPGANDLSSACICTNSTAVARRRTPEVWDPVPRTQS